MRKLLAFLMVLLFAAVHGAAGAPAPFAAKSVQEIDASVDQATEVKAVSAVQDVDCCAGERAFGSSKTAHCSADCVLGLWDAKVEFAHVVTGYFVSVAPTTDPGPSPGFLRPPILV